MESLQGEALWGTGDVPSRVRRFPLELGDARGLSGLGRDDLGAFWSVAEADGQLIRLADHREAEVFPVALPVEGLDLEGIAYLGDGTFALATESREERQIDRVFYARLHGERAVVEGEVSLNYAAVGLVATSNRGIEGICSVGDTLVAVGEAFAEVGGERHAPVFVWRQGDTSTRVSMVRLTTDTGKLAGLWCESGEGNAVRVFGIERHYTVMRIVGFSVDASMMHEDLVLDARLLVELSGQIEGDPNPEGLVWDRGRYWIITDNWYGEISGPSELISVEP